MATRFITGGSVPTVVDGHDLDEVEILPDAVDDPVRTGGRGMNSGCHMDSLIATG